MRLRDHDQPCEHGYTDGHYDSSMLAFVTQEPMCPGGRRVSAVPMVRQGGLAPGWYVAPEEPEPDGWMIVAEQP